MRTTEEKTPAAARSAAHFFGSKKNQSLFFADRQVYSTAPFFSKQASSHYIQPKSVFGKPEDKFKRAHSGKGRAQRASESKDVFHQSSSSNVLQKKTAEKAQCPSYETGELEKSRTQKGHLANDVFIPSTMSLINRQGDLIIADFGVNWGSVKESTRNDPVFQQWINAFENNPEYSLEITGYSDCSGFELYNDFLRKRRAKKVFQLLDKARARVNSVSAAPENEYLIDNADAPSRAINRGVAIHFTRTFSYQPDIIDVDKPKPKPKPKTKPQTEKVDTEDCDKSQVDALSRAMPLAKKMVRAALGEIENEHLMKKYFGKDAMKHRYHIKQNFVSILDGLKWGPTFECEDSDSWWCDGAVARVIPIVGLNIHICPAAIANGDDYLARTLVHEAGHGFAFIFIPDDLCEGGWTGSTTDAEDNADCYGEFAGEALKL